MSDTAILVENLSKRYHIGKLRKNDRSLREALTNAVRTPFRRGAQFLRRGVPGAGGSNETIWALKDVSFEVKAGEAVGIIGRNGAGKSTLLKILSRVTEPTSGRAKIYGKVGCLLEVGTGFHPELSGRDNIYLYGVILGMRRFEIRRKFEEIVDFSEVEAFIDTPVKRYSSGMYLRLAFAVAAYLQPRILLVDEVLAVGDGRFQKKCLEKMEEVGKEGRTVLFVSHNMQAVTRLCKRILLLDKGKLAEDGPSHTVVKAYLGRGEGTTGSREWSDPQAAPGGKIARLRAVRVRGEDGRVTEKTNVQNSVSIEMEYDVLKSGYLLLPHCDFWNEDGLLVFKAIDLDPAWRGRRRPKGWYRSRVWIPPNFLAEGTLFPAAGMLTLDPAILQYYERESVSLTVLDSLRADSARGDWMGEMHGVVRPAFKWETQYSPNPVKNGS